MSKALKTLHRRVLSQPSFYSRRFPPDCSAPPSNGEADNYYIEPRNWSIFRIWCKIKSLLCTTIIGKWIDIWHFQQSETLLITNFMLKWISHNPLMKESQLNWSKLWMPVTVRLSGQRDVPLEKSAVFYPLKNLTVRQVPRYIRARDTYWTKGRETAGKGEAK